MRSRIFGVGAQDGVCMTAPEIDPTQPASINFNRRAFVGITAAATVAASAPAGAQGALGQTHQPMVSEKDPAIAVDRVELQSAGATVPAYAAWPVHAGPATPSVIVIMHIWGVDTSIRDFVRRLAKAGFSAMAPELYARFGAPSGDAATDYTIFRPYAQKLERAQYDGDVKSALLWLRQKFPHTKTAIAGFCMGGRIAMLAAIDNDTMVSAVCPFYGSINDVDPHAITMPLCGSYGARDDSIPAASVRAFAQELTVPHDVKIYDNAGHAFMDDQRKSYVASAAADAWERTIAFLRTYLGTPA